VTRRHPKTTESFSPRIPVPTAWPVHCYLHAPCPQLSSLFGRSIYNSALRLLRLHRSYKIMQQPDSFFSNVNNAARVAASKTSSTPSPVRDEHSRYLRAPISWPASLPSFEDVKCCDFFRISSCAMGSSRRSFFKPTRMMGTSGHRSRASSTHFNNCR
jgi:hypothetical protein